MTRLSCDTPGHGLIDPHIEEDAFLLAFNLRDYEGHLWVDGKKVSTSLSRRRNFTIYDYRRIWTADMRSPFDGLGLHIPRTALNAYEEDLGGKRVDTFQAQPGRDIEDDVVRGLMQACLPAVINPEAVSRLFQDHIAALLVFHLCTTYGDAKPSTAVSGALAPWQLRRAIELLESNLAGDISLSSVAGACGLSQSHFIRAFRLAVGHPPYRWVVLKRLQRAQELLRSTDLTVAEVSFQCGFCDQAHLTRTFAAKVGVSPARWRRMAR